MDASLKTILGIRPPATPRKAPAIPAPTKSLAPMNDAYARLGLPRGIVKAQNPLAIKFHEAAPEIIFDETRGAALAIAALRDDRTLAAETRVARQVGVARMAVLAIQARLSNEATPLLRQIQDARALVDKAMNRKPAEPMAAIAWQLRVSDTRRALDGMAPDKVMAAAKALADRADEVWPETFHDSLRPYLPDGVLVDYTKVYQRAFAGDQVALLEEAEDALEEIRAVINCAELAIAAAVTGLGLPTNWTDFPVADVVKAWPKPAKAQYLQAKGESSYVALLEGGLGLDSALGVFRPTLAEV